MFKLSVENIKGQIFELTHNEGNYQVIKIDGLNPPPAQINSSGVAGMDGSRFASSKLGERNIVIYIKLNGDVEANRLFLYKFFRTKQYCKLYFKHDTRNVYAEGYVETIECDLFELGEMMQVSIICHDPYLKAVDEIVSDISQVISLFSFPFAFGANGIAENTITDDAIAFSEIEKNRIVNVINEGEEPTGIIIEITALGTVVNPIIYNNETREYLAVNLTLSEGDVLMINTNAGQKSITYINNGISQSYLRYLQQGSTWFTLFTGDNLFTYAADEGDEDMQILFKYRTKFEAV